MGEPLMTMSLSMKSHVIKTELKDNFPVGAMLKHVAGANTFAEHVEKCLKKDHDAHDNENLRPASRSGQRPSRR